MSASARQNFIGSLVALAGVALVTALYHKAITDVKDSTIALSFLLVVLISSSAYGLVSGIIASVAGMLCFNYFFLPPIYTFTIADSRNWVALFVFLVTAVITSQLSS